MARDLRRSELERRNADALAFLKPVLAVGALAVDTQFALPNDALDVGKRQAGKARLEKAIDAHVVLVRRHHDGLHFDRQWRQLGNDLFGLGNERRRPRRARCGDRKTWRGLAARTMRLRRQLRTFGLRAAVRARALGAVARWAQRSLDAAAHGFRAPDKAVG